MFQHFDLLVIQQNVAVVKRIGEKLLGNHIFARVQFMYVVTKKAIGTLYDQFSVAEIKLPAAGGGNDVSIDRHGSWIHSWKI